MAMDFFAAQDTARRRTGLLIAGLVLAILSLTVAIHIVLTFAFQGSETIVQGSLRLWDVPRFLWTLGGTVAVVMGGSLSKTLALRRGGSAVAEMLGGVPLDPDTRDPAERRLQNVVEEMAIAAGVPVPVVYVLPGKHGINAFAAGTQATDAVIGVTRACLQHLDRAELQGVVAHEFSHILNGDMRLNLRLIGILHGLLLIAIIGRILLHTGGRSRMRLGARSSGRGRGSVLPIVGLALMLLGYLGVFFGKLIKSAVSRQREFLADAAAVQFTRNPGGLAGALRKIGGLERGSRVRHPHAEEASHLFFGNAMSSSAAGWLSTHPPLVERIRRLDPSFSGKFPELHEIDDAPPPVAAAPAQRHAETHRHWPVLGSTGPRAVAGLDPLALLALVGHPSAQHLDFARQLIKRMPAELVEEIHQPPSAAALVLGLLLASDAETRASQLDELRPQLAPAVASALERIAPRLAEAPPDARLPLAELASPALARLSRAQFEQLALHIERLCEADGVVTMFEYALQRILLRRLRTEHARIPVPATPVIAALRAVQRECHVLLSMLARVGTEHPQEAQAAFAQGMALLAEVGVTATAPLEEDRCTLQDLDSALDKLAGLRMPLRRRLLHACAACIAHDRHVAIEEAELLRVVALSLECPLPPLLTDPLPEDLD